MMWAQNVSCDLSEEILAPGTFDAPAPDNGNGCYQCTDSATHAVWYNFTLDEQSLVTISSCQFFGADTRLWLYSGDCGNLTLVTNDEDGCGFLGGNAATIEDFVAEAGVTYYLEWDNATSEEAFSFDFEVTEIAGCLGALNIQTDSVTHNSAEVVWQTLNPGSTYYLEYAEAFQVQPGTGTVLTGTTTDTNRVALTGLNSGSIYSYYIVEQCDDTTYSDTSDTEFFFTEDACGIPNAFFGFQEDSITQTTVTINWDAQNPGAQFTIEYGEAGFAIGTGTKVEGIIGVDGPPVTIEGLTDNTDYDYYYYEVCTLGPSDTAGPIGFTTLPYCSEPFFLQVEVGEDGTSAVVNWFSDNDTADFEIEYGPEGFTQGSGTVVSGSIEELPATISGLDSATFYDVYVREKCPNGYDTDWIGPETFNTPFGAPDNDDCADAIEISCGNTYSGNTEEATDDDTPIDPCAVAPGENAVWYVLQGNDQRVTLDLCVSDFNTILNVYQGTDCFDLTCVTGNDGSDFCDNGGAAVSFNALAGETYYVLISGAGGFFGNPSGNYELTVTCGALCDAPENDDCLNPTEIELKEMGATDYDLFTNVCALPAAEEAPCGGFFGGGVAQDVWFSFATGSNGSPLELLLGFNPSTEFSYAIYEACGFEPILCNANVASDSVNVLDGLFANSVYVIQVWNSGGPGVEDDFGILVRNTQPESISDIAYNQLEVFPVPTTDNVQVKGLTGEFTYQLLDLAGKEVAGGTSQGKVSLNTVESGVYQLVVTQNAKVYSQKVVKE